MKKLNYLDSHIFTKSAKFPVNWNIASLSTLGQDPITITKSSDLPIDKLVITRNYGRFGNNFFQIANAAVIATSLGVKEVIVPALEYCKSRPPIRVGRVNFRLKSSLDNCLNNSNCLSGCFFAPFGLESIFEGLSKNCIDDITKNLSKILYGSLVSKNDELGPDCIAVHFRGGDIFSDTYNPNYVQPPATYYISAIEHAKKRYGDLQIHLICEDRLNPAISVVESHLKNSRISFRSELNHLKDDLHRLLNSKILVCSSSTLPEAALCMSKYIKAVYSFRAHSSQADQLPFVQSRIFDIIKARKIESFLIDDANDGYIRPKNWLNTAENRALIANYSQDYLRIFHSTAKNRKISAIQRLYKLSFARR